MTTPADLRGDRGLLADAQLMIAEARRLRLAGRTALAAQHARIAAKLRHVVLTGHTWPTH